MDELVLIKQFETDTAWMKSHKNELKKKYANEFVAVKNSKVIGSDEDLKSLVKELNDKGIDAASTAIEFIPEKNAIVLY